MEGKDFDFTIKVSYDRTHIGLEMIEPCYLLHCFDLEMHVL